METTRKKTPKKKVEVIPVGKIWAVKRLRKIVLYTENKSEAVKAATDLVKGNKELVEVH